jgi:hypothetical protein
MSRQSMETKRPRFPSIRIIELTHGIYRAKAAVHREPRTVNLAQSSSKICAPDLIIHPANPAIAQSAGRIEAEQAAKGIVIPYEDLGPSEPRQFIRGFCVVTLNEKHFRLIPNLKTVRL